MLIATMMLVLVAALIVCVCFDVFLSANRKRTYRLRLEQFPNAAKLENRLKRR